MTPASTSSDQSTARWASAVAVAAGCAWSAAGGVTTIGPFTGEQSDPLNYPFTLIAAEIPIFNSAAKMVSVDGVTTYIHLLQSSTLSGDPVTAHTGNRILGFTQGPGYLEFNPPVRRFGSYFNNNSFSDDATLDFYDAGGNLLSTLVADIPAPGNIWTWNGWESDIPIARIRITGNGIADGFLWTDDLEISYLPEPATALLIPAVLLPLAMPAVRRAARRSDGRRLGVGRGPAGDSEFTAARQRPERAPAAGARMPRAGTPAVARQHAGPNNPTEPANSNRQQYRRLSSAPSLLARAGRRWSQYVSAPERLLPAGPSQNGEGGRG